MVENEALRQVDRAGDSATKSGGEGLNLLNLIESGSGRGETAQQKKDEVQNQISGGSGTEQGGHGMLEMTNPYPENNVCLPEGETPAKPEGSAGEHPEQRNGSDGKGGGGNDHRQEEEAQGGGGGHKDGNVHRRETDYSRQRPHRVSH